MAVMPGADYRPLSIHGGPMTGHDIACAHTMVGSLWGTDAYFQSGVANSHFGTGGDGHLVQWLDTKIESWANLDGNPNVISCENADMGPEFAPWTGSDVPAFTDAQAETLAGWLAWVCSPSAHASCPTSWTCHREGIPLELIPDDKPGRRGVGYHRHGIDDWRVPAGVLWSSHRGKVCPGDRRIAQVPQIITRAKQITSGTPTPPPVEDDDMKVYGTTDTKRGYILAGLDLWWEGDPETFNAAKRLSGGDGENVLQREIDVVASRLAQRRAATTLTPAAVAAAVVTALPPGSGDLTADQLTSAVKAGITQVLTEGVGAAPASS